MEVQGGVSSDGSRLFRVVWLAAALFVVVCVLAYLSISYTRDSGRVAAIWPGNAFIVCALLRSRYRSWPWFVAAGFAGTLAANVIVGEALPVGAGFSLINAAESLLCAWACRRLAGPKLNLRLPRHLTVFGAASLGAPLASGLAAALLLWLASGVDLAPTFMRWFLADALGLLVITPALLALSSQRLEPTLGELRHPRSLLVLLTLGVALFLAFGPTPRPLPFLLFPALILCALRLSEAAVGLCLLASAAAAIVATRAGVGAVTVVKGDAPHLLVLMQLYMATATLMALSLSAAFSERKRFQEEAERAAAAKAAFMANISHEIRTPLTAVVGYASLLARREDLPSDARTQILRIADAGDGLLSIVNDVLDFSKIEAGRMVIRSEPAAPTQVIRSVLAVFAHRAEEKTIALTSVIAEDLPERVLLDPNRLRQILVNLVGNAMKFTEAGDVAVTCAYLPDSRQIAITVRDTGCGMDERQQALLFERFSQVEAGPARLESGTGLGLAISRDLVHAMGGRISVTSAPGRGSEFTFTLDAPPCAAPEAASPESPIPTPAAGMSGIRVLVVDDNPINRDIAKAILIPLGVTVTEAADGVEAVAKGQEAPFDLILMDLRMPHLNGPDAAQRLRDEPGPNRLAPILAFSADIDADFIAGASGTFNGYVRKPLRIEELIEAVESALAA